MSSRMPREILLSQRQAILEREREREMSSRMPREISFSHNGQAIRAILVDDRPAGDWTLEEICSICNHPLGDRPFFTTDPFLVYVHVRCAYDATAALASPLPFQSRSLSCGGSRHIPYFPSAPPSNASHPSSNSIYTYQAYNYPSNYPTCPPPPNYYYNQSYQYPPPPPPPPPPYSSSSSSVPVWTYQQTPNYYYNQLYQNPPPPPPPPPSPHSSSSSSSVPVWTGFMASTVLGSLLQSLFSELFSTF